MRVNKGGLRPVKAALLTWGLAMALGMGGRAQDVGRRPTEETFDPLAVALALQERFAQVVSEAEPSVVSIIRLKGRELAGTTELGGPGDPRVIVLQRWPGRDPTDPSYIPTDYGSGVVLTSDGLILTASHVVEEAAELYVRLQDGALYKGRLWAADPRSDLAVVKIEASGLKPIRMGDASTVRKGHMVLALGNPFATARDGRATASWGIVANVRRKLPPPPALTEEPMMLHHYGTLLQTDCRLDIGTSGGALLNLHGEMIGLITALPALHGYDQPAGFAIPIDGLMKPIVQRLTEGREVEYGFLGIRLADLSRYDPRVSGLEPPVGVREGVLVEDCYPACPAYLAGLRPGDVVTEIDGKPIRTSEELIVEVGTRLAGSQVVLTVVRQGKTQKVPVELGKYPVGRAAVAVNKPPSWRGLRVDWVSVVLRDLPTARDRLQAVAQGAVVVREVEPGSPAARAGLREGMLITAVGKRPVRSPLEFRQEVDRWEGPVELTLETGTTVVVAPR
jgi:serine protease Do